MAQPPIIVLLLRIQSQSSMVSGCRINTVLWSKSRIRRQTTPTNRNMHEVCLLLSYYRRSLLMLGPPTHRSLTSTRNASQRKSSVSSLTLAWPPRNQIDCNERVTWMLILTFRPLLHVTCCRVTNISGACAGCHDAISIASITPKREERRSTEGQTGWRLKIGLGDLKTASA